MNAGQPPYRRIVADIQRRIIDGEMRPGDPVPTTRAIMRDWGVAMATATKALATLKQEGFIESRARVGAVVAVRKPARQVAGVERDRVVRAAVRIADAGGLQSLSMRAVAAELGIATMTLYRHLEDKSELTQLIADAAFAEIDYPEPPPGWRSHLRVAAQLQWAAYQRHPWLPRLVSITRPVPLPGMLAYGLWTLSALDGLDLDPDTRLHVYATLVNYVRGTAVNIETEAGALLDTGMTNTEWARARLPFDGPLVTQLTHPSAEVDLESLFAFGLERLLDGLTVVLDRPRSLR
ncbi:GntR family transcriptional regulator [Nocardia carnea]|uniref:GntR family transcriptional regulator n=1 Tax=Nocardia carnea TaxID=37328 RepID=UPI00245408B0|nr:GntR family transcriptional regulator [Nocardia carnea]